MPIEPVERLDDPRLDDYRNVPDAELLAGRGLFVAEGRLVVERLLDMPRYAVRSAMLTPTAREAIAPALARRPDVLVYEVSQATMNGVTGFNLHRGCLAIAERPVPTSPEGLAAGARCLVALERVANADNVGSIVRSATALGADGLLLDATSTDPFYRKALRTSMGAVLQLPFARATSDWAATLDGLSRAGFVLAALTPRADAPTLAEALAPLADRRLVLLAGHEGEGLGEETLARCPVHARIPMQAGVDSLNVATATAIALYELARGRDTAPLRG